MLGGKSTEVGTKTKRAKGEERGRKRGLEGGWEEGWRREGGTFRGFCICNGREQE